MSNIKKKLIIVVKTILILIAGYVALRIVNLPRTWILNSIFDSGLDTKGFPISTNSQIVYLIYIFIAGTVGAFVVGILSHTKPWTNLWIFCFLLLINDIYAIISVLESQPIWVKVVIFATLIPQVWIGGKLAIMTRKK